MNRLLIIGVVCATGAAAMAAIGNESAPAGNGTFPLNLQKEIETDAKFLAKLTPPPLKKSRDAKKPSVTLSKPDACGKEIENADMITKGANITVNGGATVPKPAEESGTYTFWLSVKVTNSITSEVIRDVKSAVTCAEGNTVNLGYLEHLKSCYCDATDLRIAVGVLSISPTGKSEQLYYDECNFKVKPK